MFYFLKRLFTSNNEKIKSYVHVTVTSSYTEQVEKLLQAATVQKKEKNFAEACLLLIKAYDLGSDTISIQDRLRLPMYLQLANRNDEGWEELSTLFATNLDAENQHIITNQIRIFLYKEKRFLPAVPYGIYSYCKLIEQYRKSITRKRKNLEEVGIAQQAYFRLDDESKKYNDGRREEEIIKDLKKSENIENEIFKLLKKAKKEHLTARLFTEIKDYIDSNSEYNFSDIDGVCKKVLL